MNAACSGVSLLGLRHFSVAPPHGPGCHVQRRFQGARLPRAGPHRVSRVRDRIPAELVTALKQDATGTVKGFRTVDGQGIGLVVELAGGQTAWFFDDEVIPA